VRDAAGAPLLGVFVALNDSTGAQRNAGLSGADGSFILRAPYNGRFTVRAELIGHKTVTQSVVAPAGDLTLVLDLAPIALEALQVGKDTQCTRETAVAQQTARLWEEVRKALRVASWNEKQNGAGFSTRSYQRRLEPNTLKIIAESNSIGRHSERPFQAVSLDTLAKYGFARNVGDSVSYFGPDADVLLSDLFVNTHCFGVRFGHHETAGMIGLTFKPMKGDRPIEVNGTLWLDPRTSELKYIEYYFTPLPMGFSNDNLKGRTNFARLQNGAWIVSSWYMRLPVPQKSVRSLRLAEISEVGAEILDLHR
jgi:hypothetical protein